MIEVSGTAQFGTYDAWATAYAFDLTPDALTVTVRVHFDEPLTPPSWWGGGDYEHDLPNGGRRKLHELPHRRAEGNPAPWCGRL